MKKARFLLTRLLLSVVGLFLIIVPARADGAVGFRTMLTLGSWTGMFWQEGSGQKISLNVKPAIGTEFQLGFSAGPVFLQWSPTWYWVQKIEYSSNDQSTDSSYFSLGAIDLGLHVPPIPVDLYAGIDRGTLSFSSGSQANFSGYAGKVGAAVYFGPPRHARIGLRAEARKHFFVEDSAGQIPGSISTTAYTYLIGLTFGYL